MKRNKKQVTAHRRNKTSNYSSKVRKFGIYTYRYILSNGFIVTGSKLNRWKPIKEHPEQSKLQGVTSEKWLIFAIH